MQQKIGKQHLEKTNDFKLMVLASNWTRLCIVISNIHRLLNRGPSIQLKRFWERSYSQTKTLCKNTKNLPFHYNYSSPSDHTFSTWKFLSHGLHTCLGGPL